MWLTRHKNLAMSVGIGLAAVLLIFVALIPIFNNASSLSKKIKTKTTELDTLTNKVTLLSKLDANILQDRVKILDNALPPKKDVLLYLASIDGLSRELGLTFGGITLTPGDVMDASTSATKDKKLANGLQNLDTEIKMTGTQDSIYSFLRTIESVLPLMQIKDIKVGTIDKDQYSLALVLSMLWAEPASDDVKGTVALFGQQEEKYFSQLAEFRHFDPIISPSVASQQQQGNKSLFEPYTVGGVKPRQ